MQHSSDEENDSDGESVSNEEDEDSDDECSDEDDDSSAENDQKKDDSSTFKIPLSEPVKRGISTNAETSKNNVRIAFFPAGKKSHLFIILRLLQESKSSKTSSVVSKAEIVAQRCELAAEVSATRILTDEDFKKIEAAQMNKQITSAKNRKRQAEPESNK